ncbi:hypothetical protein HHB58_11075, partial [Neisseria meningitidis]|nr:hypothetical protein [Neisseria meningitidis]
MNFIFFEFYNFYIFIFFIFYKMPYKYNLIEAKYKTFYNTEQLGLANNQLFNGGCVDTYKLQWPSTGPGMDQRVGNKINNVSIRVEYDLGLTDYRTYLLSSNLTTAADPQFFMKCRLMVIDIPDEEALTAQQAYDYFTSIFEYYDNNPAYQSTHTKSLRVNGPYNGMFNILYDEPFMLTLKHPEHHKVFNLKLKDNLEFKPGTNNLQNHNYYIW